MSSFFKKNTPRHGNFLPCPQCTFIAYFYCLTFIAYFYRPAFVLLALHALQFLSSETKTAPLLDHFS
jgi:hypothetical protein